MTRVFATAKKPSSRQRSVGLSNNIPIFCPSFLRPINICFLDLYMAPTLRENTLLRALVLEFCSFVLWIWANIEDLAH